MTRTPTLDRGHHESLKSMSGVPGVLSHRLDEAKKVRHCALSLVGEPIMYPDINELIELLHLQGKHSHMPVLVIGVIFYMPRP